MILAETGSFDRIVHFADRRVNRVDRDVAEGKIFIVIAIGRDIAAAALDAHFDVQLAAFADGCDVQISVEHFDVVVGLDLAAHDFARSLDIQTRDAHAFADHLERNLFQVEDDIGGVFDHAGNGAELMRHAIDTHAGDGGAFNGAKQHTAETGADRGSESAFERLCRELAETLGESLGVRH